MCLKCNYSGISDQRTASLTKMPDLWMFIKNQILLAEDNIMCTAQNIMYFGTYSYIHT